MAIPPSKSASSESTPARARLQLQPARWWRRLLAIVYDALVVLGLLFVAEMLLLPFNQGRAVPAGALWHQIYLAAVIWAYFALSWWRGGQTVATRAWRMQVRDLDGRYPSLARASLRAALALPSLALGGLGLLWCLIDREGQSAHDRLSGTQLLEEASGRESQ